MPTYTLAMVQADIATTRTAINDILTKGSSQSMRGRTLTRADLGQLRAHLQYLTDEEARLDRGGSRSRRAVLNRG